MRMYACLFEKVSMPFSESIAQFKLEYAIKKACFISNKTYLLRLENGSIIIKAKKVNRNYKII